LPPSRAAEVSAVSSSTLVTSRSSSSPIQGLLIGIIFDDTVWMVNILSYSIFAYNESHYKNEGYNS
jgi:hypothetical protein